MSEGSYNESDDEDLFAHPDDEMPAAYIIDVDSEADYFEWVKYKDSWPTQAPEDLEQCYRVEAKRNEARYFESLSVPNCKLVDPLRNMPRQIRDVHEDELMTDLMTDLRHYDVSSSYHEKLKVLCQQAKWRHMIDKSFVGRYRFVRKMIMQSKYRLGTQYLRRMVLQSFDVFSLCSSQLSIMTTVRMKRMEYEVLKIKWFEGPENAGGIVEIIEAFTDNGRKVMKDRMEEQKDAVRTYEEEFCSVLRLLDDHWESLNSNNHFHCDLWIRNLFASKQVREYEDVTFIEVIVKAYIEHNDELKRNAINAFWEYRKLMKPFYKYRWFYNEVREKKRQKKAVRRKKKGGKCMKYY